MASEPLVERQTGSLARWLPVVMVGALVLAVAAGIYRHEERDAVKRAAARNGVVTRETQNLERKVAAAQANLTATRGRLRAQAANAAGLLKVLDQLKANHASMSTIVRDQDGSSARIVDALAAGHYQTYNNLADRFTASTGTVDALAAMETKLRNSLTRSTCGANCGAEEDAAHLPRR
jgi:hypothetical protein